jgi:hypothetical protein
MCAVLGYPVAEQRQFWRRKLWRAGSSPVFGIVLYVIGIARTNVNCSDLVPRQSKSEEVVHVPPYYHVAVKEDNSLVESMSLAIQKRGEGGYLRRIPPTRSLCV